MTTKISLASQAKGNLPVANLNSGTGASNTSFWRGDGTWAAAGGGLAHWVDAASTSGANSPNPAISLTPVNAGNVDAVIVPKGTGAFLLSVPDNTDLGGNKRGQYAVDFQMLRDAAYFVASGNFSITAGGLDNTASGAYSATLGGLSNESSGQSSVSFGYANTAQGLYSVASGSHAMASRYGQQAVASGLFSANGDAQGSTYTTRTKTIDATPKVMFLDGPVSVSQYLTIDSGQSIAFSALVSAATSTAADSAHWMIAGAISNNAGTTALVGVPSVTVIGATAGASAWSIAVTADNTVDALIFTVTGVAATTIRWVASIKTADVTFP